MTVNREKRNAYLRKRAAEAAAYVKEVRDNTYCERCGGQPIEWHHEDHPKDPRKRPANMAGRARPIKRIQEEIDRCTALCHRCHMIIDGRMEESARRFRRNNLKRRKA